VAIVRQTASTMTLSPFRRRRISGAQQRPRSCVPVHASQTKATRTTRTTLLRRSRRHQSSAASEQRRCPKSIALRSCSALLSKTTRQTLLRPSRRHQSSAAEHYWRCRIALHPCTATTKTTLTTRRRASRRHRTFAAAQHRRLAIRSSMSKTTLMTACHRASRRRPDNAVDLLQWFAPRWTQIRQRRPDNAVDLLQWFAPRWTQKFAIWTQIPSLTRQPRVRTCLTVSAAVVLHPAECAHRRSTRRGKCRSRARPTSAACRKKRWSSPTLEVRPCPWKRRAAKCRGCRSLPS